MIHYYERNITEIRDDHMTDLKETLIPLIFEGIQGLYNKALNYELKYKEAEKVN